MIDRDRNRSGPIRQGKGALGTRPCLVSIVPVACDNRHTARKDSKIRSVWTSPQNVLTSRADEPQPRASQKHAMVIFCIQDSNSTLSDEASRAIELQVDLPNIPRLAAAIPLSIPLQVDPTEGERASGPRCIPQGIPLEQHRYPVESTPPRSYLLATDRWKRRASRLRTMSAWIQRCQDDRPERPLITVGDAALGHRGRFSPGVVFAVSLASINCSTLGEDAYSFGTVVSLHRWPKPRVESAG